MSTLQKSPRGYLGALDLKGTGFNPTEAPSVLATTFDASDLYTTDLAQTATNGANLTVQGDTNQLGVGSVGNQAKLVDSLWCSITVATADVLCAYAIQYQRLGETQFTPVSWVQESIHFKVPAAGTYTLLIYREFERPLVLLPGSFVRVFCINAPAAARASTIGLTHRNLP